MEGFTLPNTYHKEETEDTSKYLKDVIGLLKTFSWVYDFQLTRFATECTWKCIPVEWTEVLSSLTGDELKKLSFSIPKNDWPLSLQEFLKMTQQLSLPRDMCGSIKPLSLDQTMKRGMGPKKCHEVSQMSGVVTEVCRSCSCSLVLDVGAGLGYLSAALAGRPAIPVLALECKEMLSHGTQVRGLQQELPGTLEAMTFRLEDNTESFQKLQTLLRGKLRQIPERLGLTEDSLMSDQSCSHCQIPHHHEKDYQPDKSVGDDTCPRCLDIQNGSNIVPHVNYSGCAKGVTHDSPVNSDEVRSLTNFPAGFAQADVEGSRVTHGMTASSRRRDNLHQTTEEKEGSATCDTQGPCGVCPSCSGRTDGACRDSLWGVCMVGLHCCGSLTPTMMKAFLDTPEISSLVCVSCCYHGIQRNADEKWKHFPLSRAVEAALGDHPDWYPSVHAFRLAAQETSARWAQQTSREHQYHMRNVGFRAILEVFCEKEKIVLTKAKRKLARRKDVTSFDSYMTAVLDRSNILQQCPDAREKLQQIYDDHKDIFPIIEPFTALQVSIQPVLESLILVDRVLFLKEAGISVSLLPIFDDYISPRNIAIIAYKGKHSR